MKRLEQIFNRIKEGSMTERAKRYEIEVGIVSNAQDREDLTCYSTFNTNVLTSVIAYLISNIEGKKFNTHFKGDFKTIIAADGITIPDNFQIENGTKDIFCFSPEKFNIHTQFYYLCSHYCLMDDMLIDYPYSYIKDFIDYVISYRIKTNTREISDNELYLLVEKFIANRMNDQDKSKDMDFKEFNFLNRLEKPQDIIDILNRCIDTINEEYDRAGIPGHHPYVDNINISDEPDRRDINGARYMYVESMSGLLYNPTVVIYDFAMESLGNNARDFSDVLKRFMTEHFGEEYLQALLAKRQVDAQHEVNELKQYLPRGRK